MFPLIKKYLVRLFLPDTQKKSHISLLFNTITHTSDRAVNRKLEKSEPGLWHTHSSSVLIINSSSWESTVDFCCPTDTCEIALQQHPVCVWFYYKFVLHEMKFCITLYCAVKDASKCCLCVYVCVCVHLCESGLFVRSDVGSAHRSELLNGAFAVCQRSSQTCKLGPTYKTYLMKSITQLNWKDMHCVHTVTHTKRPIIHTAQCARRDASVVF